MFLLEFFKYNGNEFGYSVGRWFLRVDFFNIWIYRIYVIFVGEILGCWDVCVRVSLWF